MLTKNFQRLQIEVLRHVEADRVKQGSYKTDFIGCLAMQEDDPEYIEREYGIPLMVSSISDSIFDGLSPSEAASFFAALPDAIETDGKDLTRVGWQFLAAELRALPTVLAETQAVVAPVIAGMDRLANGLGWPAHEAESASKAASAYAYAADDATAAWAAYADSAAAWSAYAAAACADWADDAALATNYAALAADSADFAARAFQATALAAAHTIIIARRRQRDTLLKLIKEAPITITQENREKIASAFDLGREKGHDEMLGKVISWIKENSWKYVEVIPFTEDEDHEFNHSKFAAHLRKAMYPFPQEDN